MFKNKNVLVLITNSFWIVFKLSITYKILSICIIYFNMHIWYIAITKRECLMNELKKNKNQ